VTGIAAGTAALIGAAFGWQGAAIVALLALLARVARSNSVSGAACVVGVVLAGLCAWRADGVHPPDTFIAVPTGSLAAEVVTPPVQTASRQHFVVEPRPADGLASTARICVTSGTAPIVRLGDTVELDGSIESAGDQAVAVRAGLGARDCSATVYAMSVQVVSSSDGPGRALADVRTRLGAVLRGAAPGDSGVLLAGLVTGEDEGFSPERRQAFIQTGTTHLTAVSGSNLALVAGMLATIGAATFGRHRTWWQGMTIVGVWGYALVSGSQPPSIRAAIVATAAICAFRVGRRPDFATLILLAAGAMVIIEPRQIGSLGFLLSVSASLALALTASSLLTNDRTSRVAVFLTATVSAQLATLPFLLPVFGTVSLTSVPANIVAAPLVALAMPLAALAAVTGLIWPPLGEAFAAPAAYIASTLIGVVDVLAASGGYITVGVPPLTTSAAIAATAVALIFVIGRRIRSGSAPELVESAVVQAAPSGESILPRIHLAEDGGQRRAIAMPITAVAPAVLTAPAPRVVAREDPFDALAAHPDDPEEHPASKENRHEVADKGKPGETVPGELVRHLHGAHSYGKPEDEHDQ
jgi:ComEC/Rec2-related protein